VISVIIPAHNAANFLAEAIESVLAQTATEPKEIVVCDDGSTDETEAVCRQYQDRIVYLRNPKSWGANHARNAAVKASNGQLLAFLDSDDLWLPDKLEQQLQVLRESTAPSIVFGECQEFDENGPRGEFQPCCLTSLCLLSREDFDRVGPFDESLRLGDFAEWLSRAQELGLELLRPPIQATRRRHHSSNSGKRLRNHRNDYLEVVRRRLARKRAEKE
jgi:glycosyltransferase involved in cell wall biosynthesis